MDEEIMEEIRHFRDSRNWKMFHNPKDLEISINLEAAELLEIFQWSGTKISMPDEQCALEEELADVLIYCMLLADVLGVDLKYLIRRKLAINENKYKIDRENGHKG